MICFSSGWSEMNGRNIERFTRRLNSLLFWNRFEEAFGCYVDI